MTGSRVSHSRIPLLVLAMALSAALAVVGAVPASAGARDGRGETPLDRSGPEPTSAPRESTAPGTSVKHVVLQWQGAPRPRRYSKSFGIPGVGRMTFTCRPDETRISLFAGDRDRETQMWMAKYEDKSYGRAVAVKTVRIYRYAHAFDDGRGGTANPQHEGLNQRGGVNGVENYAKGYAHGVISQRGSRNVTVGTDPLAPVTTFDFNWYWNGFDYPAQYRFCKFEGTFVTKSARIGVNWHGEADAEGNDYRLVRVPDLGYLELRCEAERYGRQTVALIPDDDDTLAYVETIEGEGRVDDQVETRNRLTDAETGRLGPMALPTNGIMRFYFDVDGRKTPFILSSYQKLNDRNPRLNTCEVAMGQFPR
ncbi:MAG: hypothetical protein JWN84_3474 [Nocardioides sp.]|nr:hypothetical protein [Nocardioides sp.]